MLHNPENPIKVEWSKFNNYFTKMQKMELVSSSTLAIRAESYSEEFQQLTGPIEEGNDVLVQVDWWTIYPKNYGGMKHYTMIYDIKNCNTHDMGTVPKYMWDYLDTILRNDMFVINKESNSILLDCGPRGKAIIITSEADKFEVVSKIRRNIQVGKQSAIMLAMLSFMSTTSKVDTSAQLPEIHNNWVMYDDPEQKVSVRFISDFTTVTILVNNDGVISKFNTTDDFYWYWACEVLNK